MKASIKIELGNTTPPLLISIYYYMQRFAQFFSFVMLGKDTAESILPEMKKEIEANMLENFGDATWPVLYFAEGYALIRLGAEAEDYMVYQKQ